MISTSQIIRFIPGANACVASNEQEENSIEEYIKKYCQNEDSVLVSNSNFKDSFCCALNYALAVGSKRLILPDTDRLKQDGLNPYVLQYSLKRRGIKLEFAEENTCPENVEEYLEEYQQIEDMLNNTAEGLNDMTDIHYHN